MLNNSYNVEINKNWVLIRKEILYTTFYGIYKRFSFLHGKTLSIKVLNKVWPPLSFCLDLASHVVFKCDKFPISGKHRERVIFKYLPWWHCPNLGLKLLGNRLVEELSVDTMR